MRIISDVEAKQLQEERVKASNALCDEIARLAQMKGLTEEKYKALLDDDFQE